MTVTEGPYAGYSGEEPEYEGMASMASQIGVTEAGAATMLANECDSLGFDVNELGWLLGWVIECSRARPAHEGAARRPGAALERSRGRACADEEDRHA